MRSIILTAVFIAMWLPGAAGASSQGEARSSDAPTVHTYGDISYENQTSYLDDYAIRLNARPESFAHIVVRLAPTQPPGVAYRKLLTIRNYLVWYKNVAPARITMHDGGRADCFRVELRLAPSSHGVFVIDPNAATIDANLEDTLLYDSYVVVDDEDELIPSELTRDPALIDQLAHHLQGRRQLRAVLIGYARTGAQSTGGKRWVSDLLHAHRRYLQHKHHVAPTRVDVVFGGYRSSAAIDLYIVPPTGASPAPTPTRKPLNRR